MKDWIIKGIFIIWGCLSLIACSDNELLQIGVIVSLA